MPIGACVNAFSKALRLGASPCGAVDEHPHDNRRGPGGIGRRPVLRVRRRQRGEREHPLDVGLALDDFHWDWGWDWGCNWNGDCDWEFRLHQ